MLPASMSPHPIVTTVEPAEGYELSSLTLTRGISSDVERSKNTKAMSYIFVLELYLGCITTLLILIDSPSFL